MTTPSTSPAKPQVPIRRADYAAPAFFIDDVELDFDLGEEGTEVKATLHLRRNPAVAGSGPLRLQGGKDTADSGDLKAISVDGTALTAADYLLDDESLTIKNAKDAFVLTTTRRLKPSGNKSLEGLYTSGGGFFTQCEAEGFRKITWFLDRPDVMSRYVVTLRADPARFPVLLSNGNRVSEVDVDTAAGRRRVAVWRDPWPKPCYLFALVAGDLSSRRDSFVTSPSGRTVELNVWVRAPDLDQTAHCMDSIKKSMRWDEERFGREYDLDVYNLVAVSDFNMGAMENKGLNIFNTKYVLARPDTATDVDYGGIEGVVGHEYFHNWSGNRVTCRDWFQLSLKEGFTVFRDQEFSADVGSRAVRRIEEVRRLRSMQFPEDAGPTSHPVRPDSFVEISNFYTMTIYEKGAEVVRMLHTLLGEKTFRQGTDRYFKDNDGKAVTCDDFVAAMAAVSGRDLSVFSRWYSQSGTPELKATTSFDALNKLFTLTLSQETQATPDQATKEPLLLPVKTALLGAGGKRLALSMNGRALGDETVLEFSTAAHSFVFDKVEEAPVVSLLREFSAPVKLSTDDNEGALLFRLAHDDDAFNRCEAGQELFLRLIEANVGRAQAGEAPTPPAAALFAAIDTALQGALNGSADASLLALALSPPALDVIGDRLPWADYASAHLAREALIRSLATALASTLKKVDAATTASLGDGPYAFTPRAVGLRSLRNLVVGLLARIDVEIVSRHLARARDMTDTQSGLALLALGSGQERDAAFAAFYQRWKHEALVIDKWFALQAQSTRAGALNDVEALLRHPDFSMENPNRVRSVVGAFSSGNPLHFHDASGRGYLMLGERVRTLDAFNPQIAARMLTPLTRWKRQNGPRQQLMRAELHRVLGRDGVSNDVAEIATKALGAA